MKKIFLFSAAVLMSVGMSAQLGYNAVYSENDYNNSLTTVENDGDNAWDEGIRLGGSSTSVVGEPAWNWDRKYIIIELAAGIPDSLYFSCKQNADGSTGKVGFRVCEGTTKEAITEVVTLGNTGTSLHNYAYALKSTTRFISLEWHSNFAGYYSNVKVTPATTYGTATGSYCQGGSFEYYGKEYTEGTYEGIKLKNYFGGDSIVTLTVTENPVYETTVVDTMTYGETKVYYEQKEYTADTVGEIFIDTIVVPTVAGCDSTLYFKMVINKAEQEISWNAELTEDTIALFVGDSIEDLAFADSKLELTYIMSKDSVVIIENNVLIAIAADTVAVAPMQEGNKFYNSVFVEAKVFIVAEKPSALINTKAQAVPAKKVLVNGKMVIIREDKNYNILGTEVR